MIARFPSSPPTDETLFEFLREFEKTPIGFRQILSTDDRGQVAYLEGAGTGGVPLLETRDDLRVSRLGRCQLRSATWSSSLGHSCLTDSVTIKNQRR
jgi:hypothetical protein